MNLFTRPGRGLLLAAVVIGAVCVSSAVAQGNPGSGTFTDSRDGQIYKAVRIGGKTWMAQNLNYRPQPGRSGCYDKDIANCNKYGRLYDWKTAMIACPMGWHLPTVQEWDNLMMAVGGKRAEECDDVEGCGCATIWANTSVKLKARSGWANENYSSDSDGEDGEGGSVRIVGTDNYGFAALPGGMRSPDGTFTSAGQHGMWWTATEGTGSWWVAPDEDSDNADYRGMYYDSVSEGNIDKGYSFSVRCVQN